MLRFTHFGKSGLKQLRVSPDASLQLAFQLAYERVHGTSGGGGTGVSVYESASTKPFLGGRTEAIRSCTTQSRAFVLAMIMNDGLQTHETRLHLYELLREAASRHSQLGKEASAGLGVDRHLFALSRLAEEVKVGHVLVHTMLHIIRIVILPA